MKNLLTAAILAETLGLTVEAIHDYTQDNIIPSVTTDTGEYRYRLDEVISALADMPSVWKRRSDFAGKKYTYQDYLKMPDEPGYRYEILDGDLVKEPSPGVVHQAVSINLLRILLDYFQTADPGGKLFHAPLDVTLGDRTVVQPDILFISSDQLDIVKQARIEGAPLLAVEIISPSTREKDYFRKLQIYQHAGVRHYWLIDPQEQTFQAYCLDHGPFKLVCSGSSNEVLDLKYFPGLEIPLADLWPNI